MLWGVVEYVVTSYNLFLCPHPNLSPPAGPTAAAVAH